MPKSKKGGRPAPDILEILHQAEEKNKSDRSRMKTPAPEAKDKLEKTIVASEKPKKAPTKITKRINAETAELIDMYSDKKDKDELSDTQKLRIKLKEQNGNDPLLGYITETEKKPSERVEKLYDMINDAKTRTLSDSEKKIPAPFSDDRFVDESEVPKFEEYHQEEMFPLGDTLRIGADEEETPTAKYDEEYGKLTEKVTNGEVPYENENENESEGQVKFITDDDDKLTPINAEPLDETDINLRLAFEMMDDEDGNLDSIAEKVNKAQKKSKDEQESKSVKYVSREQNSEMYGILRKKVRVSLIKTIIAAVLTLAVLFLELATKDSGIHSEFTKPGRYGILYILIDLQLLFFVALTLLDSFRNGIKGIFSFRLNTDSLLVISVFFAAAYSIVMIFTDPQNTSMHLYCLPAAFCGFCSALSAFLNAKKNLRCFKILASKRPKYTACELKGGTKEADEFYNYLFEDSELYTVKKANFIDGFTERCEKRPKFFDIFNFIVPAILLAGVILFAAMKIMGHSTVDAYSAFSVLIAASVPSTAFFAITLPLVSVNRVGRKHATAFVGNAVTEEYSQASVLSFADTEVFPSNLVKITNISLYGDSKIDDILADLAKLFDFVGGPLAKVLSSTFPEKPEKPSLIRIIESANDGLCIAMDGKNYFLGRKSYMKRYRFEAPVDDKDEKHEREGGSIMYVTIDEKISAKLYLKYTINPLFDNLLKDMYKADLCLGIKTLDPNITTELVNSEIHFHKCPVSVLRSNSPEEVAGETERADSGIACNSTLHSFLSMFALCDKTRHITKSNAIISIVSVFLSFGAVAFLALVNDISAITSLHAVAFQLFWQLPVWLISFFMM